MLKERQICKMRKNVRLSERCILETVRPFGGKNFARFGKVIA